jgi:hypothetical protein
MHHLPPTALAAAAAGQSAFELPTLTIPAVVADAVGQRVQRSIVFPAAERGADQQS